MRPRPATCLLWLLAGVAWLGCTNTEPVPPPKPAAPDPVASFDRVVQNLRHYLGQLQNDLFIPENGAFTDIRHRREVTKHEVTPPTDATGDYQGVITITTKWTYSFRPSNETPDEESPEDAGGKKKKEGATGQDATGAGGEAGEGGDLSFTSPSSERGAAGFVPKAIEKSQADEEVETFRFIFRDNQWELVEEEVAASESEQTGEDTVEFDSTKDAVERALKQQQIGRP